MATQTANYNFKKPAQTDYYNINDFNDNMDAIDTAIKENSNGLKTIPIHRTTIKTSEISSSKIAKDQYIVVAEKGHYSNGSALILVEASGSLMHHSLILSISSSFSEKPTIACLGNSAYATALFKAVVIETVWNKQHIICLRLNTDIDVQSPVEFKVTVISEWWTSSVRLLGTYEFDAEHLNVERLIKGTTAFDKYLPLSGGTVAGLLTVDDDITTTGNVEADGNVTATDVKATNNAVIKNRAITRAVELYNSAGKNVGGYIDFHYGKELTEATQTAGAEDDFSARIVEDAPGELNVMAYSDYEAKLKVAGKPVYDESRITVREASTANITAGTSQLSKGNIILVIE